MKIEIEIKMALQVPVPLHSFQLGALALFDPKMEKLSVMEMFIILTVVVSKAYMHVKIHQIVHLNSAIYDTSITPH